MDKIKVLIVDDSPVVRQAISAILSSDKAIEIIGMASNPFEAADLIKNQIPDVITLDIEMPKMDGLTFLKKIMSQHPIPVVIISRVAEKGSDKALIALEYGAVDVISKTQMISHHLMDDSKIMLCDIIKAASKAKLKRIAPSKSIVVEPKLSADVILTKKANLPKLAISEKVIAIGASTGGTEAIVSVLKDVNINCSGILVVQHMPEFFTKAFAERLNEMFSLNVKEAENGDIVQKGKILIAPGNKHMLLKSNGLNYVVEIKDGPLVNRHRPSVDVLFRSVAQTAGCNALGILLTGMGDDGARGLLEMKEAGAQTIAQDEKTSIVFGMPREAIALGAAQKIAPLQLIGIHINNFG